MVETQLRSMVSLYNFSTAFRLLAWNRVQGPVQAHKLKDVENFISTARGSDDALRADERQFARQTQNAEKGNVEAKALDIEVDRLLSAIPDAAKVAKAVAEDESERQAIDAFIDSLFPRGLAAVVNGRFVDELSAAEAIAQELDKQASMVKTLGLVGVQAQLKKVVPRFSSALSKDKERSTISYDDLRARRAEGQERLAQYLFMTGGRFPSTSAADIKARASLWGPILELNEQLGQTLKRGGNPNEALPEGDEVGR
jgi:hypothetical protein